MNLIELLKLCKDRDASDLHLPSGSPPMLRVTGKLERISEECPGKDEIKKEVYNFLTDEQKVRFERDKELDFSIDIPNLARFRVNLYSQRKGESAAFRLIPNNFRSIERLGLPIGIKSLSTETRGLVLVTGPTGSGKTTTLAAIIDLINQKRCDHIITIEDPIEYVYEPKKCLIDQREVGTNTASFCSGLKNALREDPDVILVGEMRDLETISMALTAAETGHLVFATLHTNSAAQTISRIVDVFPSTQQEQIRIQLADAILGIISQILLPTVDEKSRVCAAEVLMANLAIRNLIREGKTHQIGSIMQTGKKEGMQTLDQSLEALVMQGKITKQEAIKRAINKSVFKEYDYGR